MARYFFNIHNHTTTQDDVGSEHPDMNSVRAEAVGTVHEVSKGRLLAKGDLDAFVVNVTDALGVTVLILSLSATVQTVPLASPLP